MSDTPDRRHRDEIVADLVAERKRTYDLERENAALRERIAELEAALRVAQEEERERLIRGAEALRDPKEATDEYSLGWDDAIRAVKEAAIREGR